MIVSCFRFSSQGWVSNWDHSAPSVWLTAYVIRILEAASFQVQNSFIFTSITFDLKECFTDSSSFQDWEDYIYIDPTVFGSAVMWLLNYQSEEVRIQEGEKAILYFILFLARRSKGFFPIIGAEHNLCQMFSSRFLFQGAFQETEYFERPLHYAMQSEDKLNISLTAHVLIALTETADKLTGDVKRFSNTGQLLAHNVRPFIRS